MRKIGILIILVILMTTGCGQKKTLTCTVDQDMEGMVMSAETIMDFEGTTLILNKNVMKFKLDESILESINEIKDAMAVEYKALDDKDGVSYSLVTKDDTIIVSIDIDYTKVDYDAFKKESESIQALLEETYKNISVDKTKESLEDQGYSCKIK